MYHFLIRQSIFNSYKGGIFIMYNYYEFTNLYDDLESFAFFDSLSNNNLKDILNENFNYIESYLNNYAEVFKTTFQGKDYDEFYYSCKSLIEELNNIKIILNILKKRDKHE